MRAAFAFLADAASEERPSGKLHALGIGIDSLNPPSLPFKLTALAVVASIEYSASEAGQKEITIRLVDADGTDVVESYPRLQVQFGAPQSGSRGRARLVVNFQQLQFENPGDYAVHVTVDGNDMAELPLRVNVPATT